MSTREQALLAAIGFGIWLSGAVTFRFAGALMFESGPLILLVGAVAVAISVCLLLITIMNWRRLPAAQSVPVAVVLILPGLFGDAVYALKFAAITGLNPLTAAPYAATMFFGTAVLLAFALWRAGRALA